MDIYIDKDNLLSFIRTAKSEDFADCERWLKRQANIFFNFSKQDIENESSINDKQDFMQWFKSLSTGTANNILPKWDCNFPKRPLKTNIHKDNCFNHKQLSAVYLLNDEKCDSLKRLGNFLFASVGQEVETISSLFFNDYQFTTTKDPKDFTSWRDLQKYTSPCSDIIVADKYIFSNGELLESNIYMIIEELVSLINNAKINILFFTLKDNISFNCNEIIRNIKSRVKKKIGVKPNVTIVATKNIKKEHDRTIFTNYRLYNSGDTFNYFNSKNERITNGRYLHIHSNALTENMKNSFKFIKDMQNIVAELLEKNTDCIHGDKECNYISLS